MSKDEVVELVAILREAKVKAAEDPYYSYAYTILDTAIDKALASLSSIPAQQEEVTVAMKRAGAQELRDWQPCFRGWDIAELETAAERIHAAMRSADKEK